MNWVLMRFVLLPCYELVICLMYTLPKCTWDSLWLPLPACPCASFLITPSVLVLSPPAFFLTTVLCRSSWVAVAPVQSSHCNKSPQFVYCRMSSTCQYFQSSIFDRLILLDWLHRVDWRYQRWHVHMREKSD